MTLQSGCQYFKPLLCKLVFDPHAKCKELDTFVLLDRDEDLEHDAVSVIERYHRVNANFHHNTLRGFS